MAIKTISVVCPLVWFGGAHLGLHVTLIHEYDTAPLQATILYEIEYLQYKVKTGESSLTRGRPPPNLLILHCHRLLCMIKNI